MEVQKNLKLFLNTRTYFNSHGFTFVLRNFLGFIIILILISGITPLFAAGDPQNGEKLARGCAACHGLNGISAIPVNPNLAGQNQKYLIAQLNAFAQGQAGNRFNLVMQGFAISLTKQQIEDLAEFYAKQRLVANTASPQNIALGQRIYQGGIRDQQIPACSACHSPNGSGNAEAGIPRLSGQHAEYVVTQLDAYKKGSRKNDLNGMMQQISEKLTPEQIKAVANYIQGLQP